MSSLTQNWHWQLVICHTSILMGKTKLACLAAADQGMSLVSTIVLSFHQVQLDIFPHVHLGQLRISLTKQPCGCKQCWCTKCTRQNSCFTSFQKAGQQQSGGCHLQHLGQRPDLG